MKLKPVLLSLSLAFTATTLVNANPAPVIDGSPNVLATSTTTALGMQQAPALGSLEEKIAMIERKIDSRNKVQVNVQRQLDELQMEVDELRGVTEQHSHQLSQVLERQRELYQELERRVSEALKVPSTPVVAAVASTDNKTATASYSQDLTENESYDRALNMVLIEKRYEEAIPEFRSFNAKYPNSTYAANAHYWLGQLLYNKGEYDEAAFEFNVVVTKYQDSNKRSDALLKLAMVEQKRQNSSKAKILYRQLTQEYPDSNAAKLAMPRLEALAQ